jgi:hypothetical protein
MLDLRLYRASLLPFVAAVLVAAFSLSSLPTALSSPLPPSVFSAARAFAKLENLAAAYPRRAPGSPDDDALAAYVAQQFRADGLTVRTRTTTAATVSGERRIETVIATRAGRAGGSLVLLAHRDATGAGAAAALSGTAALLELARDLSVRGGLRPLTFVSTSGGSGGNAGALAAAALIPRPVDAVIVIGAVAGASLSQPFVVPWSPDGGAAPLVLQLTVDAALAAQLGGPPPKPDVLDQLARFAIPLTVGEQAPLEAAGLPAVLVQASGELAPSPAAAVSPARLGDFGRGILAAIDALQRGGEVPSPGARDLTLASDLLGSWAARLVVGLLILACAACTLDAFARARRAGLALAPWFGWALWWAAPFLATALFAKLLALTGLLPPVPPSPVTAVELPLGARGAVALVAVALVFAVACVLRVRLVRGPVLDGSDQTAGASVALLCIASVVAVVLWIINPYTAALLALPLALWLPVLNADEYRSARAGLLWLLCSLAPLGLVLGVEASSLGLGPISFFWVWLLVFAGGQLGLAALLVFSLAGAVSITAALLLLHPGSRGLPADIEITVRGPASYAGPGSLGGTPSAIRRPVR